MNPLCLLVYLFYIPILVYILLPNLYASVCIFNVPKVNFLKSAHFRVGGTRTVWGRGEWDKPKRAGLDGGRGQKTEEPVL